MENNTAGLKFLYNNRKILIVSIILGGLLGLIVAFITPAKYMSSAIIYPANSHTQGQIISNPQFGYEIDTEQLLQLLESKSMRDKTVKELDLINYYEIDTNVSGWNSKLTLKYIKDVAFFRSKYLSIVIRATTKDPLLSAKIANFQVEEINRFRESIFKANRTSKLKSSKIKFASHQKKMIQLKDSIYLLIPTNGKLLYNHLNNLSKDNYNSADFTTDPNLEQLIEEYVFENMKFKALREETIRLTELLNEPLPKVYIIDSAVPSYRKTSPSYSLHVVIGALFIFIIVATGLLFSNKLSELKKNAD